MLTPLQGCHVSCGNGCLGVPAVPKIVTEVSVPAAPIHPICHTSGSAKAVGSAGCGQVKGQALGLKTAEQMVSFYLKAEFRASESPWKKLTLAEWHHPNKQGKRLRISSISCTVRVGSKAGQVCQGQQDAGSTPRWQVSTAGACATCQHRYLALSSDSSASGWSCAPKGFLEARKGVGTNQATLSIPWWCGASLFHFK